MRAQARLARGQRAELAVAEYLLVQGFELLMTNARVGRLEIDLVARKGPLVAIVEVRTRGAGSYTTALESVTLKKQQRLLAAAKRLWAEKLSAMAGVERVRIDVAGVSFEGGQTLVDYIEAAIAG